MKDTGYLMRDYSKRRNPAFDAAKLSKNQLNSESIMKKDI